MILASSQTGGPGFYGVHLSGFRCLRPGGQAGKRGYPPEVRRKVLDLLEEGRTVAQVAHDLDINEQSICAWRRQDRIDK